jgi:hypothetical protein
MSFASEQYKNAVKFKENLQDNEENGYILTVNGKPYHHFFKKTQLNLWENIREDALKYFSQKGITWHTNDMENNHETVPEGNMLSSQISCVNHLFLLRKKREYATAILKNIDKRIVSSEIIYDGYGDDGYIEFESWGTKENHNPLNEKEEGYIRGKYWKRQRGSFSTSVDAVMVGKKIDGKNLLILMEWKFTEDYTKNYGDRNIFKPIKTSNSKNYDKLLEDKNCPIKTHHLKNYEDLYYEPFYQLMRQTLLGWKMIETNELGCDEYVHLHIIPKENLKIQEITSPNLKLGCKNMSDVWKNLLKESFSYKLLSPEELLSPLKNNQNFKVFFDYLNRRYLEKYI